MRPVRQAPGAGGLAVAAASPAVQKDRSRSPRLAVGLHLVRPRSGGSTLSGGWCCCPARSPGRTVSDGDSEWLQALAPAVDRPGPDRVMTLFGQPRAEVSPAPDTGLCPGFFL